MPVFHLSVMALMLSAGLQNPTLAQAAAPSAQEDPATPIDSDESPTNAAEQHTSPPEPADLPVDPKWVRLSPDHQVWIDKKTSAVIAGGQVCHREGPLEMFACPVNTKEYESVVAINSPAFKVHAALLAVGIQPGRPVQFLPKYQAARGPIIEVEVLWQDANGNTKSVRAQEWVQNLETKQAMKHDWVFAGSGFWTDPETKQEHYHAEGGELICVSNFSTATMDLPVASPQDNNNLMFFAWKERIPPLGTKVHLRLTARKPAPLHEQLQEQSQDLSRE